jgi:hypothetical protein
MRVDATDTWFSSEELDPCVTQIEGYRVPQPAPGGIDAFCPAALPLDGTEPSEQMVAGEASPEASGLDISPESIADVLAAASDELPFEIRSPFEAIAGAARAVVDAVISGSFSLVAATFDACQSVVDALGDSAQQLTTASWYILGDFLESLQELDFTGMAGAAGRLVDNLMYNAPLRLIVGGFVGVSHILDGLASAIPFEAFRKRAQVVEEVIERGGTILIITIEIAGGIERTVSESVQPGRRYRSER